MIVSLRDKKTKKVFASNDVSPFMGPTYITKWIMRQAKGAGYEAGGYEYKLGNPGVWQS